MVEQASSLFSSAQARRLFHRNEGQRDARRFPSYI
jgi:hypothetical protein